MVRQLPPLNAVKAFEASARLGGFVAAAQELGVSPAAVSLQVKNLEAHFGVELFTRKSNGITLTELGESIFRQTTDALGVLADLSERINDRSTPTHLVVSVMPSLSVRWLIPSIAGFCKSNPDIGVEIREEADPVSFQRDNIDIRIAYGAHIYTDYWVRDLIADEVSPMGTPAFFSRHAIAREAPTALPQHLLIHPYWRPSFAYYPTWNEWFAHAGLAHRVEHAAGHSVAMTSNAIELALSDLGIALGQLFLAARELTTGELIMPYGRPLRLPHAYALVVPHPRLKKAAVRSFTDWAIEEAGATRKLIEAMD